MDDASDTGGSLWPSSSTHIERWVLPSLSHLNSLRENGFNRALERIRSTKNDVKLPTFEEELWLLRFYTIQLSRFIAANHMKDCVKETALAYFNRFYLRRSMLEHDPRVIMFSCVTLAIKLEDVWRNYYIDKLLGAVDGLNVLRVFEQESTVCDALDFNFLIIHTSDTMHVLRMRCIEYIKETLGIDDIIMGEHLGILLSVCTAAEKDCVVMHEVPELIFVYTPTQLAVGAFSRHCKAKLGSLISFDGFLLKKLLKDDRSKLTLLTDTINRIVECYDKHFASRSALENEQQKAGEILDMYLAIYSDTK
ncbi:Cyclin N-terminal domain family protein [Babesia bovis T2Bo]|uniref:Cyclin N-terminal domain family protein n=1 Tax=Babesia bovis T2Bo TaxID=484906 RepID=UPI001C354BE1|nr:Cyclin N-terminal domain family protein [Babesia bovis T2Bo]EDO08242.2 Cyclin N-terminal domain family protein [Babesia bovis T2Bo]